MYARMNTRRCKTCEQVFPLTTEHFTLGHPHGKPQWRTECKPCWNARGRAKRNAPLRTGSKVCSLCSVEKPRTEFYAKHSAPDGLTTACKTCQAARRQVLNAAGPPEGATRKCAGCKKERPLTTKYFYRHKSGVWGFGHRCKPCEWLRGLYSRRPLQNRARASRRRARERLCYGNHTAADIEAIYERQRGLCAFCYEPVSKEEATVDHYIPIRLGGRNDPFNLLIACGSCNYRKQGRAPGVFALERRAA